MNAPEPKFQDDPQFGRYERSTGQATEWWQVTLSDRPQMYRIEHGHGDGPANIDTVVDLENLKSKLQKWHREGFFRPGDPGSYTDFIMQSFIKTDVAASGLITFGQHIELQAQRIGD